MGCRLVACITIAVIICLELLTNIVAVPAQYGNQNDADVHIPIHKRSIEIDQPYTFESKDQPDDQLKTIYAFSADPKYRLSIKFESIEIDHTRDDVVNVYSGRPQYTNEKSKTTDVHSVITQAQFKEQTKRMPLLISSKSASDMIENVLILTEQFYDADSNELTVLFDKSFNGQFKAIVEAKEGSFLKNHGGLLRNSRDPASSNSDNIVPESDQKSFALCKDFLTDEFNPNIDSAKAEVLTGYKSGVIRSHPEFGSTEDDSMKIERYANSVCKAEIKAEQPISIDVTDIKLADYDLQCTGHNLLVENLGCENGIDSECTNEVRICDENDKGLWKFSNHVRLTLTLGTFLSDASGFRLTYKVDEPKEITKEAVEETTTGKKKTQKVSRSNILEAQIEENPDVSEQAPTKPQTTTVVKAKTSSKNTGGGGPYPGLFIISVIVVAILLIIILSAAGAIACYRNHQQEQIINNMHERLSDIQGTTGYSQYSPVDGSNASLRTKIPNKNLGVSIVSGSIVCQKPTEEDSRLLSSPESSESQK
jgi:hypothetical protein